MKKVFVYLRKSIERESEKSIDRQRELIEEYASENNMEIVKEFSEVASSATLQRPALQQMMQELGQRSDIDYILVYSFDRISREMDHFGWLLSQLKEILGVKTRIHSMTEDNDYEDDHYKLFFVMMRTFGATDERVRIVERLQGARQVKQQKGGFIGGTPPLGYKSLEGTGKLYIQEDEVPIVQRVFDLRGQGMTMQQIADQLNEEGFKTRQGRDFKPMTVQRVLKNEDLYRGKGLVPKLLN
ncbi:recombinase family protein [Bacillus cereus]|uniref:recombinase family protein n=1 Tax=Bacillus cereus TaxID=1396 RepID=UPI002AC13904|nr:recombinase family protein [Bacillus cereus]MDZ4627236.1 recombinase family protein [Bacillus cereus]